MSTRSLVLSLALASLAASACGSDPATSQAATASHSARRKGRAAAAASAIVSATASATSTAATAASAPADDAELVVPVRVHALKSSESEHLDSTADRAAVDALIAGANEAFAAAKIRLELEKIVEEQAQNAKAYEAYAREWDGVKKDERDALKKQRGKIMASVLPAGGRIERGVDIYLHHQLVHLGGVWTCPARVVHFGEARGKSAGGEAPAKVLAHELGHAFDLPHFECVEGDNLMFGGGCKYARPEGIDLTAEQIATMRRVAATGSAKKCGKDDIDVDD